MPSSFLDFSGLFVNDNLRSASRRVNVALNSAANLALGQIMKFDAPTNLLLPITAVGDTPCGVYVGSPVTGAVGGTDSILIIEKGTAFSDQLVYWANITANDKFDYYFTKLSPAGILLTDNTNFNTRQLGT